jgi:ArsR family transcriptional regulator, arsenate/arsenite/antimonite-responsive transcriptional repressor
MGASKSILFTQEQNAIAEMSKAMGHPARVAILEYLIKTGVCVCGDIVNELPLAQATVSQHLKELKNAGLIKGCIEGNNVCYCINPDALKLLGKFIYCISNNPKKNISDCRN